jgi:uncharacterized protein
MKVLCISDNVLPQLEEPENLRRQYGDVTALISCGDMPAPYIEYIASVLGLPTYFVRGNHDTEYKVGHPGGVDLHRRITHYKGWTFAGLEGSMRYNDGPVQYTEGEMRRMVWAFGALILRHRLIARRHVPDVLVTHSPMFGVHDGKDKAHRGFESLGLFIRLYKPLYMLHGHVDPIDRRKPTRSVVEQTEVININPAKIVTLERSTPGGS